MTDETKATVQVVALQLHTYHGAEYAPGDTYACDEGHVTTVEVQGKARRVTGGDDTRAYKTTEAMVPRKAVLTGKTRHAVLNAKTGKRKK